MDNHCFNWRDMVRSKYSLSKCSRIHTNSIHTTCMMLGGGGECGAVLPSGVVDLYYTYIVVSDVCECH